jgi:hypothetical protein
VSWTIALLGLLLAADLQNLLSWWRGWTIRASWLARPDERSADFTLVVPVYGHPRYFAERERLARYRANTLVALGVGGPHARELRVFADELEAEGWRVHRVESTQPSPPELVLSALESGSVTTTFVLRMDADTYPLEDVGKFIHQMLEAQADICSVKVEVARPRTVVERIQALEYRMAMLSRHFRPWLTSGACFAARSEALTTILRRHSLWFPGEDVETGRIAHGLGMRVRHLDLRVATAAPETWRGLYRQRRLWWAGGFRHIVVNVDKNAWHMPGWTAYYLGLVTAGVLWKTGHLVQPGSGPSAARVLLALFALYVLVTFVANWPVRSPWMVAYPLYAFAQALAMPTVGAVYFCVLAVRQRRLGRYRFGYRRWWRLAAPPRSAGYPRNSPYEIPALRRLGVMVPPPRSRCSAHAESRSYTRPRLALREETRSRAAPSAGCPPPSTSGHATREASVRHDLDVIDFVAYVAKNSTCGWGGRLWI